MPGPDECGSLMGMDHAVTYNLRLIQGLITHGRECEWIEFKQNNHDPQVIGERLSALSNSAFVHDETYGYLVYGVRDVDLELVGTSYDPHQARVGAQEVENWLATQLDPRVDFKIIQFEIGDKRIVVFRVDATRTRPVSFRGIEYIRKGSYTKKLKEFPSIEGQIWEKAKRQSFETRIAKSDLNEEQVLALLDYPTYFDLTGTPLPSTRSAIIQRLVEENLLCQETQGTLAITNLGAILFAKDLKKFDSLQRKSVRVIVYKAKDRLNALKEQEGAKGYASGFEGLISFINDQLPTHENIGQALREEVHVFPPIAIRELVANMLIHQDFDVTGTGPMVEIFTDRVEISNPGRPLIDTKRFLDHNPKSRNEKLAQFMRRIKVCEERGSGVDKIVAAAEVNNLPAPSFVKEEMYFKAVLYAPKTLRQMTKAEKVWTTYLHCSLKFVSGEQMTNETVRGRFRIDHQSQASRLIKDAVEANFVKLNDPDNEAPRYASYVPFWA